MSEEGFFKRWSRLKTSGGDVAEPAPAPAAARPVAATPPLPAGADRTGAAAARPAPTLEDVAGLTIDSDYSAFVGGGVDKSVQRLALKKLFADPHFKVMDGLDMYMDDYNKPSPVSAAMLAALDHARSALRRPDAAADTDAATHASTDAAAQASTASAPAQVAASSSVPVATPALPAAGEEAHDGTDGPLACDGLAAPDVSTLQPKGAPENVVDAYTPGEHSAGMPAATNAAAIPAGPHPYSHQG